MINKVVAFAVVQMLALTSEVIGAVTISPEARTFSSEGNQGGAVLTRGSGTWTASTSAGWIDLKKTSGAVDVESVPYTVTANNSADTRIGTINISGNIHTVTQTGYPTTISPKYATTSMSTGTVSVSVNTGSGVSWTASSMDNWLSVSPASGSGPWTVSVKATAYSGVDKRVGSVMIAGQMLTVVQTGESVVLESDSAECDCNESTIYVTVQAAGTTSWTSVSQSDWITVFRGASATGGYTVVLKIASNADSATSRSGTVFIGNKIFTVLQYGAYGQSLVIYPTNSVAHASGSYGTVHVTPAFSNTAWRARSLTGWGVLSYGLEGVGEGDLWYDIAANPTMEERTGKVLFTAMDGKPDADPFSPSGFYPMNYSNEVYGGLRYFAPLSCDLVQDCSNSTNAVYKSGTISYSEGRRANGEALVGEIASYTERKLICALSKTSYDYYWNYKLMWPDGDRRYYAATSTGDDWTDDFYATVKRTGNKAVFYQPCPSDRVEFQIYRNNEKPHLGENLYIPSNTLSSAAFTYNLWARPGDAAAAAFWFGTIGGSASVVTGETYAVNSQTETVLSQQDRYMRSPSGSWVYVDEYKERRYLTKTKKYASYYKIDERPMSIGIDKIVFGGATMPFDGIPGHWRMITLTYSGSAFNVYVDGLLIGTVNDSATKALIDLWRIKSSEDGVLFDTVEVFDKALSQSEIAQLYALEKNLTCTHSVTQARFEPSLSQTEFLAPPAGDSYSIAVTSATNVPWTVNNSCTWIRITSGTSFTTSATVSFSVDPNTSTTSRVGTFTVAGKQVTVSQAPYAFSVECDPATYPAAGGQGTVYVDADGNATWTATSCSGWIHLSGTTSKSGAGYFTVTVDPNSSQQSRTGYVSVSGTKAYITQAGTTPPPATYTVTPSSIYPPSAGGAYTVEVTASRAESWNAYSPVDWITLTSGNSYYGSSTVSLQVLENATGTNRTATLVVAGEPVVVMQTRWTGSISYSGATVFGTDGGMGSITVTVDAGVYWSAQKDCDWITLIGSSSGTRSGTFNFMVDPFASIGVSRIGTISICGQKVYVTQRGYELSINPTALRFGSSSNDTGRVVVTAPSGSTWEALTSFPWITITSASTGVGNGVVTFTIADNTTGEQRTGTIIISGEVFTIVQEATALPTYSIIYENLKGASNPNPTTYQNGTIVSFVNPGSVTGYTFAGWTPSQITADMTGTQTVLANWTANSYTIAYNPNGGSGTTDATMAAYDSEAIIADNEFTWTGHAFVGWATNETGAVVYAAGQAVTNLTGLSGGVVTLYAVWELSVVAPPEITPVDGSTFSGSSQTVSITCATPGATIYYSTNGVNPKETATYLYSGSFTITGTTTVKAKSVCGSLKSDVVSAMITKVASAPPAAPVITPGDGASFVGDSCLVTITCATPDAIIYCTTNGSNPKTTETNRYKGPFEISATTTVKAIAKNANDDQKSSVTTATITKATHTYASAMGADGLTFTSGGASGVEWVVATDATADGGVAVRSGEIGDSDNTWIETTVSGSGTFSFKWRADCEDDDTTPTSATWDHLRVETNGVEIARIDGVTGWLGPVSISIVGGATIRWTFEKDESDAGGSDCVWIDSVVWSPAGAPPDPIPEIAGDSDVAGALAGSSDSRLAKYIKTLAEYNAYRGWVNAKGLDHQTVKDSSRAWLSYALDANALVERVFQKGDVVIETFRPTSGSAFTFEVSIAGVAIGSGATAENLARVFGIEGSASLNVNAFSSANVNATLAPAAGGGLSVVVTPNSPRNTFFIRIRMYAEAEDGSPEDHVVVPATYIVTFNANGGLGGTEITRMEGEAIGTLPTPTRDGYTFDGWFTAASGGTQVSASTAVIADVTYFAHWTEIASGGNSSSGLIHRWSFNGDLTDSIGGQTATLGGSVTADGTSYITQYGNSGSSYISLGSDVLPQEANEATFELWVARTAAHSSEWLRIFEIGDVSEGFSFTGGTGNSANGVKHESTNSVGICWSDSNGNSRVKGGKLWTQVSGNVWDAISFPAKDAGVEYHIAVTYKCVGSTWRIAYYCLDTDGNVLGRQECDVTDVSWSLSSVGRGMCVLGQALTGWDYHEGAKYNEFRVWNRALTEEELVANDLNGPNSLGDGGASGH